MVYPVNSCLPNSKGMYMQSVQYIRFIALHAVSMEVSFQWGINILRNCCGCLILRRSRLYFGWMVLGDCTVLWPGEALWPRWSAAASWLCFCWWMFQVQVGRLEAVY